MDATRRQDERKLMVVPFLRPFNHRFQTNGEVVAFFTQIADVRERAHYCLLGVGGT